MVSDLGAFYLTLTESDFPIYINYTLNLFNTFSIESLTVKAGSRIRQVALSPELTLKQIIDIRSHNLHPDLELLIQGPMELMISEYCPISSLSKPGTGCKDLCKQTNYFLRDRIGLDFPVYTDQYCRMHLLNSMDHCLYQELSQFVKTPSGDKRQTPGLVLRLDLRTYQAPHVDRVVRFYQEAIHTLETGGRLCGALDPEQVITELKAMTGRGITKGHYFRGVE
jgi:putative protease